MSKAQHEVHDFEEAIRCFIKSDIENGKPKDKVKKSKTEKSKSKKSKKVRSSECVAIMAAVKKTLFPRAPLALVLDTETSVDCEQNLRVGFYQVIGGTKNDYISLVREYFWDRSDLETEDQYIKAIASEPQLKQQLMDQCDEVIQQGFVIGDIEADNPEVRGAVEACSKSMQPEAKVLNRDVFVKVFYNWSRNDPEKQALVIGHNLMFDLSRFTTRTAQARKTEYHGGFTLKLCGCNGDHCGFHPSLHVKHIGFAKNFMAFEKPQLSPSAMKKQGGGLRNYYQGRFLDTVTFGKALGASSSSLLAMGENFNADVRKKEAKGGHGGSINSEYLDYLVNDVKATFSLYAAECLEYAHLNISTPPEKIYSTASITKAVRSAMGYPTFEQQYADFHVSHMGRAMSTYLGGRCEVRHRLKPAEVMMCDFKSQYPAVMDLLHLDRFFIAEEIDVRDCLAEAREILSMPREQLLKWLSEKPNWESLCKFVKIDRRGNLLPIRSDFGIALAHITAETGAYYTLPDLIASRLNDDAPMEIIEAFEIVPIGIHPELVESYALFGDESKTVHPRNSRLYTMFINERQKIRDEIKRLKMKKPSGYEAECQRLDAQQKALKIMANAAYGIAVEIQVEDSGELVAVTLYDGDGVAHAGIKAKAEKPGKFFGGPVGSLITAGGRLLLGIAEHLAERQGMAYAFCDTDSMAFMMPDGWSRKQFRDAVKELTGWFNLNLPVYEDGTLFKIEDENFDVDEKGEATNIFEPLYFLGVSSKRYCLYNKLNDGEFRIRKFSAHGSGGLYPPKNWKPTSPEPCKKAEKLGGPRFMHDFWHAAIQHVEAGSQDFILPDEFFSHGAIMQVTLSTWRLYKRFEHLEGAKPFNFITMLPKFDKFMIAPRTPLSSFYAPFNNSYDEIKRMAASDPRFAIRRSDTDEPIDIDHLEIGVQLRKHLFRPEFKFGNPHDPGHLHRRHIHVAGRTYISKEGSDMYKARETDLPLELIEELGIEGGNFYVLDNDRVRRPKKSLREKFEDFYKPDSKQIDWDVLVVATGFRRSYWEAVIEKSSKMTHEMNVALTKASEKHSTFRDVLILSNINPADLEGEILEAFERLKLRASLREISKRVKSIHIDIESDIWLQNFLSDNAGCSYEEAKKMIDDLHAGRTRTFQQTSLKALGKAVDKMKQDISFVRRFNAYQNCVLVPFDKSYGIDPFAIDLPGKDAA